MARKTIGIASTRNKKTKASVPPAPAELMSETRKNGNGADFAPVNLEDEIRRRAYELYLQRRATAGADSGDESQDWLVAEREILSRQGGQEQRSA
jgi:hypothetical protein